MEGIKKNNFLLIGISHKTASIEKREKFSFNSENISGVLNDINRISGIRSCVVLSTCNRTEIYAYINKPFEEVCERVNQYVLDRSGADKDFLKYFYYLEGTGVIEHLFNVTCGLDSMIIGEPQIFGQVKSAYALACDNKCTNPATNRLFHHAFQVGKQIRNVTSIGEGAVSIGSAAVILAIQIFGSLKKRTVLLVGAGKIGKLCAKQLTESGIERLYITNRTAEHADALAKELSGEVIPFEKMDEMYEKADIIITSITSSTPLITKNNLVNHIDKRNGEPLSLIDLGVPRNIDPEAAKIENTHLFNVDDLEDVTLDNRDRRKNEAEKARKIIKKEVDEYCTWIKEREVIPAIQNLYKKCENIRKEELEKIKHRVSSETYDAIDLVTRKIVRKILHKPTITVRASESGEVRKHLLESINKLFINDSDSRK